MARRLDWCGSCGAWITDEDQLRGRGLGGEPLCGVCHAWAGQAILAALVPARLRPRPLILPVGDPAAAERAIVAEAPPGAAPDARPLHDTALAAVFARLFHGLCRRFDGAAPARGAR